jgi:hypothetical protein
MQILKTRDYDSFTTITSNREVNAAHVKKLAESIKRKNLMWAKPALVNDKMAVIDGQHRLEACRSAEEEFHYIKGSGLSKEDMAILNTNQRNWTVMDFVNYHALEGSRPYKDLCNLINKYPQLRWSMIVRMCGRPGTMREGAFDAAGLSRAKQICGWLAQLGKKYRFCTERAFGMALKSIVETEADFNHMIKQIDAGKLFEKRHSEHEYSKIISNLLK